MSYNKIRKIIQKFVLFSIGLIVSLYAEDTKLEKINMKSTIQKQCQLIITQTTKEQVFNYDSTLSYELNIMNTGEDNCYNIVTSSPLLENMIIVLDSVSDEWSCWNNNKNPQTVGCSHKDTLLASNMSVVPLKFNVKIPKKKDIKNVSWREEVSMNSCTVVSGVNSISSKSILSTSTSCRTLSLVKPPVVDAGKDINVTTGSNPIQITCKANDSDGYIVGYEWRENNITLARTATFIYTPSKKGVHAFNCIATDDDNATASDTMEVTVL